jgi:hypothetical protein
LAFLILLVPREKGKTGKGGESQRGKQKLTTDFLHFLHPVVVPPFFFFLYCEKKKIKRKRKRNKKQETKQRTMRLWLVGFLLLATSAWTVSGFWNRISRDVVTRLRTPLDRPFHSIPEGAIYELNVEGLLTHVSDAISQDELHQSKVCQYFCLCFFFVCSVLRLSDLIFLCYFLFSYFYFLIFFSNFTGTEAIKNNARNSFARRASGFVLGGGYDGVSDGSGTDAKIPLHSYFPSPF